MRKYSQSTKITMPYTFYNKKGIPTAYTEDGCHIFLFNGKSFAYIFGSSIYNYHGKHLGFIQEGWIRDNNGKCVLFTQDAIDGPEKIIMDIGPVKSNKSETPDKQPRERKPSEVRVVQAWSDLSSKQFFDQ
ncbi:MAG: 4-fold beta flower protein [Promethearchaeota archaeon]